MAKINITHFSVGPEYMFVVDDTGKIWKRQVDGSSWEPAGELPDEPETPSSDAPAENSNLPMESNDVGQTLSGE